MEAVFTGSWSSRPCTSESDGQWSPNGCSMSLAVNHMFGVSHVQLQNDIPSLAIQQSWTLLVTCNPSRSIFVAGRWKSQSSAGKLWEQKKNTTGYKGVYRVWVVSCAVCGSTVVLEGLNSQATERERESEREKRKRQRQSQRQWESP